MSCAMSKNPGPDQKFRKTQIQIRQSMSCAMSKNPSPDQKFRNSQDQKRQSMSCAMLKNPGPYRKFRNTISPSHTCSKPRAYMQHTCIRDNTTGVGKIFFRTHVNMHVIMIVDSKLVINMHVHININVQDQC